MSVKLFKIGDIDFKVNIINNKISTISTDYVENLTMNNVNTIKAIVGASC